MRQNKTCNLCPLQLTIHVYEVIKLILVCIRIRYKLYWVIGTTFKKQNEMKRKGLQNKALHIYVNQRRKRPCLLFPSEFDFNELNLLLFVISRSKASSMSLPYKVIRYHQFTVL